MTIPVSVIIVTKNEEKNIQSCLNALNAFNDIVVVDSYSQDRTKKFVEEKGVRLIEFKWNGLYPKKRQWCLDTLDLKNDWVLFIDADEIMTLKLAKEIEVLFESKREEAGFYITGKHCLNGKVLNFGLHNEKLALFDRRYVEFPIIDDLDIPGMGEIEGHYQPQLKPEHKVKKISRLKNHLIHMAMEDPRSWVFRHQKYARWERGMNEKKAWPQDPRKSINTIKNFLRRSPNRPEFMFIISYFLLLGFMDGREGYQFAKNKKAYYDMIKN